MTKPLAIYHVVYKHENFEKASKDIFNLIRNAQDKYPNVGRCLYLDIEGHRNSQGGFDKDMLELQLDFILKFLSKWLKEISIPLMEGKKVIKQSQDNDLPDQLEIA